MKNSLYILAELSESDFDWLLSNGKRRTVPKGSVLIQEGQPVNALYLILQGMFVVTVNALDNREIAQLSSGEVLGEISLVDNRPPTATVTAGEDSIVWSIPKVRLSGKLSKDMTFACHFYQSLAVLLSDRLRGTVNWLGYTYGHGKDAESQPALNGEIDDFNPSLAGSLDMAKIRLKWLVENPTHS